MGKIEKEKQECYQSPTKLKGSGDEQSRLLAESEKELLSMKELSKKLDLEIERNDRNMENLSLILTDKERCVDELQCQLLQAEEDSTLLQRALDDISHTSEETSKVQTSATPPLRGILKNRHTSGPILTSSPVRTFGRKDSPGKDADSNSDTGLSSLHSSSDEAQYPLDTLV
jgi:hypothetical protein